ncbi:glycosyltransferase family 2 protein [Oscillatoria acuminata]|nr:glycosyltransferase family 2 protein [Oscillatoria acuminata]
MNKPFFSVVVPTYNRANLLGDTIESVLAQTFKDFELLVIDDGSTDDTHELINSFCDSTNIRYIYQENQGVGAARNTGIKNARGEWITFLDSDDLWLPNHLQSHYYLINCRGSKVIWNHSGYIFFNDKGNQFPGFNRLLSGDVFGELVGNGNFINMNTISIKNNIAKNYLFNESRDLSPSEDWELWIRLAAFNQLNYIPQVTCLTRMHSGRSVQNLEKFKCAVSKAVELLLNNEQIRDRLAPYKKELLGYSSLLLAIIYYREGMMSESRSQLAQAISHNPKLAVSSKVMEIFLKSLLGKIVSAKLRYLNQVLQSLVINRRYSLSDRTDSF